MFKSIGRDNRTVMLALVLWALGEGLWVNQRSIYIQELGATPAQVGLVLSIEGAAKALLLIPGGWLADRFGPRKLMLVSWVMGIAATALMALARDWRWIIPGEFLYGASIFVIPALMSYTILAMPAQSGGHVERSISTVFAAFSAGLIVSQPLGGLIAEYYGIRTTYWVSLALFALSTVVIYQITHYLPPRDQDDGNWRTLVGNRPFVALVAFFFLAALGVTLGWPLAALFLHDVRGYSLGQIGILAALFSIGTVIWNLSLGRVRPRWGLTATLGLVWVSMLLLRGSTSFLWIGTGYAMLGAVFTSHVLMSAAIARRVSATQRGLAFGMTELSIAIAQALAPRIAGTLYEVSPRLPFSVSLAVIPPLAVVSIVLLSLLQHRSPQLAPVPETPGSVP